MAHRTWKWPDWVVIWGVALESISQRSKGSIWSAHSTRKGTSLGERTGSHKLEWIRCFSLASSSWSCVPSLGWGIKAAEQPARGVSREVELPVLCPWYWVHNPKDLDMHPWCGLISCSTGKEISLGQGVRSMGADWLYLGKPMPMEEAGSGVAPFSVTFKAFSPPYSIIFW